MEEAIRRAEPFAVIHIDLDFFKQVNDMLGHAAGDDVLRETGRILSVRLREQDRAARIGGDEFVVILAGVTSPRPLEVIAQRLRDRFARRTGDVGFPVRLGASLGAVIVPSCTSATSAEILDIADRELYASKKAGRGHLSFTVLPAAAHGTTGP